MPENPYRLDGRTALVVGGGNGIGRAIAWQFADAGAKVAVVDIDGDAARKVAAEIGGRAGTAVGIGCDVTNEAQVAAAVAEAAQALGPVTVLVNGAAANDPSGTVLEITPDVWNRTFAINVGGAYLMSRAVLPGMIAAGGGSIIHIASQMGRVGAPARGVYCATKGALIQLAKCMAVDHARENIRVNTLSPGAVETRRMILRHGSMEAARDRSVPLHPIGRLGQPEDIARAALYLASDASSFMTGSDLLVDGGYTAV
jgi:NAD(P)-dependent dehydrogenase (short-subunit alcohol dehydrogenase family)